MTHAHFESTFSKYAFGRGGGGHKKEYAVYARENDDNYGRPLTCGVFILKRRNYMIKVHVFIIIIM